MSKKPSRVIYAFPHAGAASAIYQPWINQQQDQDGFLLQSVEIPGRGMLIKEPAIHDLPTLAARLADHLCADIRRRQQDGMSEWATFGHSFGGVLSVIVSRELQRRHGLTPLFSVVSGSIAPSIQLADQRHLLSDEHILAQARADQGTPAAVLDEPVFARRIVAQLRSDYLIRKQFLSLKTLQVDHPLVLITALHDPHVSIQQMQAWQAHTTSDISLHTIAGGHFAIYQHWDVVRQALQQDLAVAN